jgi:hypothetical protein
MKFCPVVPEICRLEDLISKFNYQVHKDQNIIYDNQINSCYWNRWFMVFNATFNNISVISWRSVSLVEET